MIRTKADWQAMRELIGLSTADLAKYLNKNIATLQYWENPSPSARRYHPSEQAWQFLEMMRLRQIQQIKDHLNTHLASLDYDEMRDVRHDAPLHAENMSLRYRALSDQDPLMMTISDILGDLHDEHTTPEHTKGSSNQVAALSRAKTIHRAAHSTQQIRRVIIHYQHTSSTADTQDKVGFNQQALAIALMLAAQGQHVRFEYAK
jgi:hypothetical protein